MDFAEILHLVLYSSSDKILTVPSSQDLSKKGTNIFEIKHQRTFLQRVFWGGKKHFGLVFWSENINSLFYFEKRALRMVKPLPPCL